jgi:glycosyltransferase involved in cell wall biosynthesis
LNKSKILVIFTFGISLKNWKENGSLGREIQPYVFLANKGYEITFLTYGNREDYGIMPYNSNIIIIPIYELYKKSKFTFINILKSFLIRFYLNNMHFDLIKTNQVWGAWVAALLNFGRTSKLVVRLGYEPYMNALHSKSKVKKFLYKYNSLLAYYSCDYILVSTISIKHFICQNFNVKPSKIKVLPNYIDTECFSPDSSKNKFNNRVLYVGRFVDEKNIIPMAKIFIDSKIQLDLIGEGECLPDLINLRDNHNANINIIGPVINSSLAEYYRKYKIFILLSKYEGHPKSLLEAMSTGLIPIGLKTQGIKELISHNKNGFLVDSISKEVVSLARLILSKDFDGLTINARKRVLNCCSKSTIFKEELVTYNKLMGRGDFLE